MDPGQCPQLIIPTAFVPVVRGGLGVATPAVDENAVPRPQDVLPSPIAEGSFSVLYQKEQVGRQVLPAADVWRQSPQRPHLLQIQQILPGKGRGGVNDP